MSSARFKPKSSSSGSQLYIQVGYSASIFVICDTGMGTAGKVFTVNRCDTWASTYKRIWPTDTSDADPIL
jgi:hypothetical protein